MNEEEKILTDEEKLKELRRKYTFLVHELGDSRDSGYRFAVMSDIRDIREQIVELEAALGIQKDENEDEDDRPRHR